MVTRSFKSEGLLRNHMRTFVYYDLFCRSMTRIIIWAPTILFIDDILDKHREFFYQNTARLEFR